jgi:hypothetical protein
MLFLISKTKNFSLNRLKYFLSKEGIFGIMNLSFFKKSSKSENRQKVKKSKGSTLYFFINLRKFFGDIFGDVLPS